MERKSIADILAEVSGILEEEKPSKTAKLLEATEQLLGKATSEIAWAKSRCVEGPKGCSDKFVYKNKRCEGHYRKYEELKNKARAGRDVICKDGTIRTYTDEGKFVLKHRYVMEQKLKRPLLQTETVVFLDGNKLNCEPDNLTLRQDTGTFVCPHCNQPFTIA